MLFMHVPVRPFPALSRPTSPPSPAQSRSPVCTTALNLFLSRDGSFNEGKLSGSSVPLTVGTFTQDALMSVSVAAHEWGRGLLRSVLN